MDINSSPYGSIARQLRLASELKNDFTCSNGPGPSNLISGLGRLNVFIGPNNSGKSRLIRSLFYSPQFDYLSDMKELRDVEAIQRDARALLENSRWGQHIRDGLHAIAALSLDQLATNGDRVRPVLRPITQFSSEPSVMDVIKRWLDVLPRFEESIRNIARKGPLARVYIPAVRTVRRYVNVGDDNMLQRLLIADYFPGAEPEQMKMHKQRVGESVRSVFNGIELHDLIHDLRLGSLTDRKLLDRFEQQLGARFFGGESISIIPKRLERVLHIKIGNEMERPIHHIGDGLQQLLILTFPHFLFGSQTLAVFVEEPELYLHPGLQRDLIEAWLDPEFGPEGCGGRQIFVATHSSQFIDLTLDRLDISVYKMTKCLPDGPGDEKSPVCMISLVSQPEESILANLGVRNSSLLLSNATIWVEGITDRLYIRHFLDLIQAGEAARMREDVHYSFVEYGGANVVHWSVLESPGPPTINVDRLCGRLLLIADQDDGRKKSRHDRIRAVLKDRLIVLPCREIENLLSPEVLGKTVVHFAAGASLPANLQRRAYAKQPLGRWLDRHLKWEAPEKKHRFAAESGTVARKLDFATAACEVIKTVDDMTEDAKELARAIISFIKLQNPICR